MNRLSRATSPYLRQHATNPVDWFEWGEGAFERARELNRPLLVSVGYAACHWCHVMAHESFGDPAVAQLMNAALVCVKVDREQRPDIDAVCMDACLALNGQGGWPLNVFMTPDQEPFFAGTYFPPRDRSGMPSWATVVSAIADAWRDRPDELRSQAAKLTEAIATSGALSVSGPIELPADVIARSADVIIDGFDPQSGGWGGAPLFPAHCALEFLLAVAATSSTGSHDAEAAPDADGLVATKARGTALRSLTAMAEGGIFDQLGGGFHRYSVDARWTVPHFEKMLYDNALLARAYLHGWQLSGEPRLLEVATATLDFAIRELQGPEGGFCSSLDADSGLDPDSSSDPANSEGAFYVWTPEQIKAAIDDPDLATLALAHFGVTDAGNFEGGANVLTARADPTDVLAIADPPVTQTADLPAGPTAGAPRAPTAAQLQSIRDQLLAARQRRARPALDDKRLTAWNALMAMALADAGAVLARDNYLQAARDCADFLLRELRDTDGRLLRSWLDGRAELPAQLDDHAYLLQALLVLYEATFEQRWYEAAVEIADQLRTHFADPTGGFFTTAADQPALVGRRKDTQDSPTPSGNAAAALGLLRLARISGEDSYENAAVGVLALLGEMAARQPSAFAHLLTALDLYLSRPQQVVLIGDDGAGPLASAYHQVPHPHTVLAGTPLPAAPTDTPLALLRDRPMIDSAPTAYVCENFSCRLPVTGVDDFVKALEA